MDQRGTARFKDGRERKGERRERRRGGRERESKLEEREEGKREMGRERMKENK